MGPVDLQYLLLLLIGCAAAIAVIFLSKALLDSPGMKRPGPLWRRWPALTREERATWTRWFAFVGVLVLAAVLLVR